MATNIGVGVVQGEPEAADDQAWPRPAVAWYALGVLSVVLLFLVLDRGIITLLVQPIKHDLHLSDTQFSLLTSGAESIFFACVGLPLARLLDRNNRKLMISGGIAVWTVASAACGVAGNFLQFMVCRILVGAGGSLNGPGTYSLLADFFPPQRLPRAIAVLNMGFIGGLGFSLILGAWVIQLLVGVPSVTLPVVGTVHNWQLVFFAVSAPGVIITALMLSVPEPKRRGRRLSTESKSIPVSQIFGFLWANRRIFGPMFVGLALTSAYAGGLGAWNPTFFQRTYGWTPQHVGYITGIASLVTAPIGLFLGTWINEHYTKRGYDDANLRVLMIAQLIGLPFAIAAPLMPTPWLSVVMSMPFGISAMAGAPSQNAALQIVTPNEMRSQVTALYLLMFTVIGGLGPTLIAAVTDYMLSSENQIRWAISGCAFVLLPAATLIFWYGVKPYGQEVARLRLSRA